MLGSTNGPGPTVAGPSASTVLNTKWDNIFFHIPLDIKTFAYIFINWMLLSHVILQEIAAF